MPPRPAHLGPYVPNPAAFPEHHDIVSIERLLGCGVVKLFTETGDCCEPTWMRLAALFHYIKDGERLFHEYSERSYPGYDHAKCQAKYDRAGGLTGPPLCAGFRDSTDQKTREICLACPHLDAIVTPLALGRSDERVAVETATTGANSGGAKPGALIWEMTASGAKKPKSYANTALAIEQLGITGHHDAFHDHKVIGGDLPENLGPELGDAVVRAVREMIVARFKFDPGKENVQEALERLCEKTRVNPVRDYLDSLKWDGAPRIDRLFVDYFGAEDTPLNRAFGRKTLLAAVRRARHPGCKFDCMPVIEAPQGAGKSRAVRALAVRDVNFSDQPIRWDDPKQQLEAVSSAWIYEVGELVGLKKADVENVKNFLSRQEDRVRPAYGRFIVTRPRHCVFIGTSNGGVGAGYLTDPTGARRFWPVRAGQIDVEAIERDRDQLWAEAATAEARGETLDIGPALYGAARVQQELRRAPDLWTDILANVKGELSKDGLFYRISTVDLLGLHLNIPSAQMARTTYTRLVTVMKSLGWEGPKDVRILDRSKDEKGAERVAKGYERSTGPSPETCGT